VRGVGQRVDAVVGQHRLHAEGFQGSQHGSAGHPGAGHQYPGAGRSGGTRHHASVAARREPLAVEKGHPEAQAIAVNSQNRMITVVSAAGFRDSRAGYLLYD
ncbi:hypothetical protein H7H37_10790, partial [Mycolicibacterium insubricum]|nr:hypothetical protein [Mycolicibacterium insubricum]